MSLSCCRCCLCSDRLNSGHMEGILHRSFTPVKRGIIDFAASAVHSSLGESIRGLSTGGRNLDILVLFRKQACCGPSAPVSPDRKNTRNTCKKNCPFIFYSHSNTLYYCKKLLKY
ncbi:unknown [Dialister sp. CAG:357]|nr:unknown [Dialister sp. CAG:357]